jgi:hypothetical protein
VRPPSKAASRKATSPAFMVDKESYFFLSTRPLHTLAFLVPLMVLYELGTLLFLTGNGMVEVIKARLMLTQALDVFGNVGFHVPPILLTVILLVWHVLERDRWRVRKDVVLGMGLESFLWTLPLFVFAAIAGTSKVLMMQSGGGTTSIAELGLPARLTLALGAGIYEELLFRLILIAGLHFVLKDLLRVGEGTTYVIAAFVSAIAFTFYHNIQHPGGGADLRLLVVYMIAGLYFAVLFILRGFGVCVATHATYDVVALSLLR